jgi:hypothetical protein
MENADFYARVMRTRGAEIIDEGCAVFQNRFSLANCTLPIRHPNSYARNGQAGVGSGRNTVADMVPWSSTRLRPSRASRTAPLTAPGINVPNLRGSQVSER